MTIPRVAIACAGLHAGVLIEALELLGIAEITLFDDAPGVTGNRRFGRTIAGPLAAIESWRGEGRIDAVMIGTANVRNLDARQRIFAQLQQFGLSFASAVHPTAFVAPSASIGEGSFLAPMVAVHSRSSVGRNVCVYTGSTIDHDNRIEDHVFISPGVHTAGEATIESGAYLGPGVIVTSGCRVGRDSIIGAGAVVLSDIPPRSVAFGAPARVVQSVSDWIARR
jgi:sugar O-acyltransferase (sialic acid O-acetyltransferase NeuD family)